MSEELVLLFDRSCPYTTGQYIERAAKKRGIRFTSSELAPLIMIDDSSPWNDAKASQLRGVDRACFWAIDTHVAFPRILDIARHFPLVYAAQHDGTEALRAEGINAHWLPVAAEPDGWHKDLGVERTIDVAFVGNMLHPDRQALMRLVDAAFDNFVIDQSQDPSRISEIYSRAKVVINHSIRNDVNMRIFEAASCGAAIVTNRIPASQWDDIGIHRWVYADAPDAVEIIGGVLDDWTDAQTLGRVVSIVASNQRCVLDHHTYAHRLDTMLDGLATL